MNLIPIDYSEISAGQGLEELDRACREWGFFELRNHPISLDLRRDMLQEMARFFSLPSAQKRRCERTVENHWGFYDRELTKNVQDWKELFDVGPQFGHCVPQWPEHLPGFQQTTEQF